MSHREKIHPRNGIIINFDGTFDLDSLYIKIKGWFDDYRYDYYEKENTEKNFPEGNFIILKLNGEREIDDYVRFIIEVDMTVFRLNKLEKGHNGELKIILRGFYVLDYKNNWKSLPFLFYIYKKIILKKKIDDFYEPKIYEELMNLTSEIKSNLKIAK
jgi:hypothetical protein